MTSPAAPRGGFGDRLGAFGAQDWHGREAPRLTAALWATTVGRYNHAVVPRANRFGDLS